MTKNFFNVLLLFFFISCSAKQGDNRILNQMITGKNYFDNQEYTQAKNIFLEISNQLNSVWNKPSESKQVRQLWYEEMIKTFKGEPYERVMLFFYLGVIFLLEGDYGNAQASFGQAILQDSFAQEEQNRADFAIAYFLQSYSQERFGSRQLAQQTLKQFQELKPNFATQDIEFGNTIILVETGMSPQKIAIGKYKEYLSYRKGQDFIQFIKISIDEQEFFLFFLGDVYWQASSRGGRPIDAIAKDKVIFKDTSAIVGDVFLRFGVDITSFNDNADAAAVLTAIGIGASVLSSSIKTKADTRSWSNLPNKIYLNHFNLEAGFYNILLEALDENGRMVANIQEVIEIKKKTSNIFYWKM